MTAEFDWWLLIVGLVIGAGLVWLVLGEWNRHEMEIEAAEVRVEAAWIAGQLASAGWLVDDATAEAVLREHRAYLRLPPPDEIAQPADEPALSVSDSGQEPLPGPAGDARA